MGPQLGTRICGRLFIILAFLETGTPVQYIPHFNCFKLSPRGFYGQKPRYSEISLRINTLYKINRFFLCKFSITNFYLTDKFDYFFRPMPQISSPFYSVVVR